RERAEQLAFIFDTTQVEVDRRQARSVDRGGNEFTFAPLVACFRASQPPRDLAWTFTVVNVRVDLSRAAAEVAKLPQLMQRVAADGRGEDDVILAGLLQADDAYLGPTFGEDFWLAVRHRTTDIYDRYQTGNLVVHSPSTTEAIGRGGVFNFPLHYKLNESQAEAITSHLPLYADFAAHEGGDF
ncbi:MAG: deoxyribonuclease I, partial [Planctomycetota bacterium]